MADKSSIGPNTSTQHKRSLRAEGGTLTRGYGVIKGTAEDQVKAATPAAARCVGVIEETTTEGKVGAVVMHGECIAVAGAAIVRGDRVKVMDGGKFEPGNAADVETVGFAVNAAAADGDEFVLFVQPIHKRA